MWYDKVILELEEKKTYSRKALFVTLQADNPQLSHNSFKWVLADIISRQMLIILADLVQASCNSRTAVPVLSGR